MVAFEVTVDPETLPSGDNRLPTYETVINYERFEPAREIMLYNTALLWVLGLAQFWVGENSTRVALSRLCPSETYGVESSDIAP
jgi:hypothetical protein